MKLLTALEIGEDCGLMTVGEAIRNVNIHATSIFIWDKINSEMEELLDDYSNKLETRGFGMDSSILEAIEILREIEESED